MLASSAAAIVVSLRFIASSPILAPAIVAAERAIPIFVPAQRNDAIERLGDDWRRGLPAGENLEGVHRLGDGEFAAGHHLGAEVARGAEQRRPQGLIDRVGDPEIAPQEREGNRRLATWRHADGGRVDETLRALERRFRADAGLRAGAKRRGESLRLGGVAVDDRDPPRAHPHQGDADGLADPAGADQRHPLPLDIANRLLHSFGEAAAVGVEADEAPFPHCNRIHRADLRRRGSQFVQQRERRLLVWISHVDASEPEFADAIEEPAQLGAIGARDFDEMVEAPKPKCRSRGLMHCRRGRMGDRRADQAKQDTSLRDADHRKSPC